MKNVEKLPTDLAHATIAIRPGWTKTGNIKKYLGEPDYYTRHEFGGMAWYRLERVMAVEAQPDWNIGSGRGLRPLPGYTREQWGRMSQKKRAAARYQYKKTQRCSTSDAS